MTASLAHWFQNIAWRLEHPHLAMSPNNLAALYDDQGKYAEAEPLFQRSLSIREKALGPEHPDVAQSLENYAALLRKMNRDAEAAQMEARAGAIREKVGKEGDPPAGRIVSQACRKRLSGHDTLTTTEIYLNLSLEHVVEEFQQKW